MFDSALQSEHDFGLDDWAGVAPQIHDVEIRVLDGDGTPAVSWSATLDRPAQSVDQRVKCASWLDRFAAGPGSVLLRSAELADLEDLARSHDLVIVSTGKGDLGRLFPPDPAKSPYDRPQRVLALTYVTGMTPRPERSAVSFSIAPGIGEYFTFPALTTTGPCDIMVFEGVPGGPMDCWDDITTPDEHLARSLHVLRELFPDEFKRSANVQLTDDNGVLRGRLTPTVRKPVAMLPSGRAVLGMADAIVLNDPITGQGSNNAAKSAAHYLDSILKHGQREFDARWMQQTFDSYWRGWGQWVVTWTNSMLSPPPPHVLRLLRQAAESPVLASAIANGFDDPRTFFNWWFDAGDADRFIREAKASENARFDRKELRNALGQYATGVTVITARAPDGRKIGVTANSFTSVSLDPPLVSWCPAKSAPSLDDLSAASHFAVNVLASDQHDLSRQFSTPAADKFDGVPLSEGIGGLPLIRNAVARFECRTVQCIEAGDHVIFLGEVERFDADGGAPLVFHAGYYHVATKHPDV
jgi:flavin reductase (DIM6/NTAB) family NADH-FMN oxidoreductase RutF